jgi:hypothetical protein
MVPRIFDFLLICLNVFGDLFMFVIWFLELFVF